MFAATNHRKKITSKNQFLKSLIFKFSECNSINIRQIETMCKKEVITPENSEGVLTDYEEDEDERSREMPSEQTMHIEVSSLRDQK